MPGKGNIANLTQRGKGRPKGVKNKRTIQRAELFEKMLTPERLEAIVASMIKASVNGDMQATKLLLEYRFGKPVQPVDATHRIEDPAAALRDIFGITDEPLERYNGKTRSLGSPVCN